ncbi:cilia- and flagella-associated protein 44-like [Macrosteles quadrilineatus]|uniref:cilia- and flagella-associated protein 44-like n=1 Tax=Macrosteles quadrilineatus TaxID=74068 RepID=UPI0023E1E4D3|nr:cilia- and flagella-associated protein 44-like [Macrosteles quadrilineatus]
MSDSHLGVSSMSKSTSRLSKRDSSLSQKSLSVQSSISGPDSEATLVEVNPLAEVLTFEYSFGYDCQQPFNLCVVDENTLVYYSGTLIHIFDHSTKTFLFKRSYSGSGIGHVVKSPTEPHLAVGEKCAKPLIVIYEWPSFNIISKMAGGTTRGYSHLAYSPDGTMLVSQGSEPDHLITIWDWKTSQIILRVKSHGQDVFNVEFSQFVPGLLTSCGLGHIKFWKMAKTFTGLKLQGELGRFGKTELCDINGIYAMPDEKVVSGSEWGNLLVWEDRLIKLEVKQKAKGNCHNVDISQIHYNAQTDDIISVSKDGWIKQWNRVTIDTADPSDDEDWYLEMQPLLEVLVKDDLGEAKIISLSKKNSNCEDYDWFGQDGNGGIWSISLNAEGPLPRRLFVCHAGSVAAMATSPVGHYLATLGSDGCLLIYETITKNLLARRHFSAPGTALIWLPVHVEATGAVLVGGFADGMLRMIVVSLREVERALRNGNSFSQSPDTATSINIIQRVKSHTAPVTVVGLNPRGNILVSGGKDCTIFIYQILPKREYIVLLPVGYLQLPGPVTHITWRPKLAATALVACADGSLTEVGLPEKSTNESSVTFDLHLAKKTIHFQSIKSELIRSQELKDIESKKAAKTVKKQEELEKLKEDNPNLDIDEELFLLDSDDEVEFPPLFYPETPSPILFVVMLPSDNFLLSMGGYDCGFLYEYNLERSGSVNSIPVPNAMNTPLLCFTNLCSGQITAFGMANGVVRLVSHSKESLDMQHFFDLPMHDTENGTINHLCSSSDGKYMFSCGSDGNIFMYNIASLHLDHGDVHENNEKRKFSRKTSVIFGPVPREVVLDADGRLEMSLEETKINAQKINLLKVANERKENIRRKLIHLQVKFEYILDKNNSLPLSQKLNHSVFELDSRITSALQEKIADDIKLMNRQMSFKVSCSRFLVKKMQNHFVDNIACLDVTVRAIKNEDLRIKAFTHNKLSKQFLEAECELQHVFDPPTTVSDHTFEIGSQKTGSIVTVHRQSILGSMFRAQPFYNKLTLKARKALFKQELRRNKRDQRAQKWQTFLELKPDINKDDPNDIAEYKKAATTIGDFNLKSAETYKVPQEKRMTPAQKYWQMIQLHREIYETKEAFNKKVCEIRGSKIALVRRFKQLYHDLDTIQEEIAPMFRKERLPIPKCYLKNNFPEHIFRLEFGADPLVYHPVSEPYDEEFHVLQIKDSDPVSTEFDLESARSSFIDDTNSDTEWEHQLKVVRMVKTLHRQEAIVREMEERIDKFDEKLEKLCVDRLKYARDIKLMEIFYLTLYQELVIINSYAGREHKITHKLNNTIQIRNDKIRQKISIQDCIDSKQQDIAVLQMKLSDLQEHVYESTMNTNFSKFLNRIFKKKRTSKTQDDSESESSTSEDSSEDELGDEDDEDFIPLKLDENVCPEGCDPNLFADIISSRNQRYEIEESISELHKHLEKYQKELHVYNGELFRLDTDAQNITEEFEAVQFEKQQKLNDVETIVVLNLSQFRHFVSTSHPEDGLVRDPLVFHSEALFNLSNRIAELEVETEGENLKIKQQKLLRQRLSKSCKEMQEITKTLNKQIKEEVIKKFGEDLNIDLMEDEILKKMINEARRDYEVDLLRKKYNKIMWEEKKELSRLTDELISLEQENSRKLKLQTMLEHETWNLKELLRTQEKKKGKVITTDELEKYELDVENLNKVLKEQLKVKEELKHEIRVLSYKCTPPEAQQRQKQRVLKQDEADSEMTGVSDEVKQEPKEFEDSTGILQEHYENEQTQSEDHVSVETLSTIDNILHRLASGKSAYDVAVSIVDELLDITCDEKKRSSALDCALQLVDQLIRIATGQDSDDVLLVEQYADSLLKMSKDSEGNSMKSNHSK